ncbi:nucleoside monophosphate kinase [Candidatus Nomurabacteria bacterium]|nr:nucleoside monophosphate kinase [Candidatus Nomurabacteria bacterium]
MNTTPATYIFFGRSGSGKGTQAELLMEYLQNQSRDVLYIETGREFRSFINEANYTSQRTKEALNRGELLPVWLPVWLWAEKLVRNFNGTQDLVLDGLARRMTEAPVVDSALKFYGRNNCKVVHINVSREEAKQRLMSRGRPDDTEQEKIQRRLDWYDRDVLDVMDYFADKKGYEFIDINGEQSVEDVFSEIREKLDLE